MLVECPNCHISFNPEMAVCPRCRTFRPPATVCDEYIRSRVRGEIESGAGRQDELIRMLRESGLANESAVEIINAERRRYKQGVRGRAMRRLMLGIVIAILGPGFLTLGFLDYIGTGQLWSAPVALILIGGMSLIVGCGFLGLGAMRFVRGRD